MSANSAFLKSSLAKKYWMAATGLFLCLFLLGHLAGNLQLFNLTEEGRLMFNEYALFMTTNPAVKILSYVTYISILFHAADGIALTIKNKKARPVNYVYNKPSANSAWSSRNMGVLGTIMLAFIVTHMAGFWYTMHWGELGVDANGNRDLYEAVMVSFQELWYVVLYVVCMVAIGFHLYHGFKSAFQSLGLNHKKYNGKIQAVGKAYSIIVPALFAAIPVVIYISTAL
jgi:succinate dehydrogenase / fumarate reductase cytochrome b subunit